ncbi:MAG: hypothetical protein JWN50_56 [Parcubacteria group bacterium]|nr:hypothetical protein [Parcubacteria group bacterium]
MVSVAIIMVMESIVVYGQAKYSETTLLNSTVSNLSLAVRSAQVYGVSVKEFAPGSNEFSAGYGLEFNMLTASMKTGYISFADRGTRNGVYDSQDFSCPKGGSSECIEKTLLPPGYLLSNICEISTNNTENCSVGRLAITFVRPGTDAHMVFFDLLGGLDSFSSVKGARVTIVSPSGQSKSVIVYITGQISIQ